MCSFTFISRHERIATANSSAVPYSSMYFKTRWQCSIVDVTACYCMCYFLYKRFASSVLEAVLEMFSKAMFDYLTTMFDDLLKQAATVIGQLITSFVTDIFCFLKQSIAWFCTEVLQAIASHLPALVSTVVSYIKYGIGLFISWIKA